MNGDEFFAKCIRCDGLIAIREIKAGEWSSVRFPITRLWTRPHDECGSPEMLTEERLKIMAKLRGEAE